MAIIDLIAKKGAFGHPFFMPFLLLLFIQISFAHIITDDVATTSKTAFTFSKVCSEMVSHESPLIEIISSTELDCMGKKINVGDFCEKELAHDPYYLRAWIDQNKKEVICHTGKKVIFKYLCVKLADKELCSLPAKDACKQMQFKLARRLDLVHSSFTKTEKKIQQLNCYFESAGKNFTP